MEERFKETKKVGLLGIIGNVFLLIIKLCIAFICQSQGMIADTLNSALDIFASVMTLVGNKVSEKPKDEEHPFGHEKAEYVFSFAISLVMLISSLMVIKGAVESIVESKTFGVSIWLYVVCFVTLATKASMWVYATAVNKKTKNILITAAAQDHRNDLLLTSGTLIGVVFAKFGYFFVDGIVGIAISVWICIVAVKLMLDSVKVLMDHNMDKKELKKLEKIILKNEKVLHIDSIAAKPVGIKFIIVLKISMDGKMSLNEAHKQSGIIKETLEKANHNITDVIIHINPHEV